MWLLSAEVDASANSNCTYDPAVGRFLQSDPLGFAAGDLNIYAYTWNDPANWSDPSGLSAAGATAEFMMYGHWVVAAVGEPAVCLANKISTALSSIGKLLEEGRNIGDLEKINAGECVTAFVAPRLKPCTMISSLPPEMCSVSHNR